MKQHKIAVSGIARSLRAQLEALPGLIFEESLRGKTYDLVIASGLRADEIARRQMREQTGLEPQPAKGEKPKLVPGELPPGLLAAVRGGVPLLALVPEDGRSEGVDRHPRRREQVSPEFGGTSNQVNAMP